jgi:hypothetical protein
LLICVTGTRVRYGMPIGLVANFIMISRPSPSHRVRLHHDLVFHTPYLRGLRGLCLSNFLPRIKVDSPTVQLEVGINYHSVTCECRTPPQPLFKIDTSIAVCTTRYNTSLFVFEYISLWSHVGWSTDEWPPKFQQDIRL